MMKNTSRISIVLSEWAAKEVSNTRLGNVLGTNINIMEEKDLGGASSIAALVNEIDSIYVLDMDIASGSRLANFAPATPAEHLIAETIIAGKKVVCSRSLFQSYSGECTPVCAREAISNVESKLTAIGIAMVDTGSSMSDIPAVEKAFERCPRTKEECTGCGLCVNLKSNEVMKIINAGADRVGATLGVRVPDPGMAQYIDHTILKPDATAAEVRKLCEEAKEYNFASVCVNPSYVSMAAAELKESPVKITTVIGFPLGATTPTSKAIETRDAIANGADEIDMVINIGALKSGNDNLVRRDIEGVVEGASGRGIVKVILETALLTDEEKVRGCLLAKTAGADFVKTSTGFGPGGATVEDIALMRRTVGPEMGIKASGGIRDFETAKAMVDAGATRIGASASVSIVKGE